MESDQTEYLDALQSDMLALDSSDLRELARVLDVRGIVLDTPDGMPLGRRHRWAIEWSSALGVLNGAREYKKTRVRFYTPEYADWESEHMPAGSAAS